MAKKAKKQAAKAEAARRKTGAEELQAEQEFAGAEDEA